MNAIRIHKQIDSETLYLPEIKPLIGKAVEIIVLEEPSFREEPTPANRYDDFFALAGPDVVDPNALSELRAASLL